MDTRKRDVSNEYRPLATFDADEAYYHHHQCDDWLDSMIEDKM